MRIFQHCPLMSTFSHHEHIVAFSEFLAYKTRVPVRGAIMLNEDMDEVVLVKGWKKGANWSFPRGKINKDEKDLDCAIREVYEETGFDVRAANLIKNDEDVKDIEVTMREQHMQLFVFRGVPRDTYFEPRTRKEISKIEWYKLADLPTMRKNKQHDDGYAAANANKFYMVAPFLHPLKKWIAQQKKLDLKTQPSKQTNAAEGYVSVDETGYANGTPGMSAAEMTLPSDLPEVASAQHASDHLKRLLKIGDMPLPTQQHVPETAQHSAVDATKSDALLSLLLQGRTEQAATQISRGDNIPPPNGVLPNLPLPNNGMGNNFFPGFPHQHQQQDPQFQTYPGLQYPANGAQMLPGPGFPSVQPEARAAPIMPQYSQPPPVSRYPVPSGHMPAPFQRTGDPEFSESASTSRGYGPAVPPASKLPPPKLTTHSLALLNAFKVKTPKAATPATLAAPVQGSSSHMRKTSQHQDGLLNLLKAPQAVASSQPAELLGNPVAPSPAPPSKHILQRLQNYSPSPAQHPSAPTHGHTANGQVSATVSGPLNTPRFDTTTKSNAKPHGGSNRKAPAGRKEKVQAAPTSSPMTILARPESAKREVAPGHAPPATSVPPAQVPQTPEPVKNFQPQILRRSDKTGHEILMAAAPQVTERKPSLPGSQASQGLAPQGNFDRRPSQTAEQKASLLSLFAKGDGRASPSAISPGPRDSRAGYHQPTGVVSPMSSRHHPSSGGTISRHGTPSDAGAPTHTSQVSSPSNKAFLLGFLEGVAKGNK
ncbi:unnamed protein product [Penicillium olsonii]|uniref:Nudix hydrolase domain-containing protein n=1 Tax=Penicillium olsonii TaxID=99116 RepID=A0A9W4MYV4_PENOL|nr:unnamed protein product [Penicillium olsonii]CAG8171261.1 unnamed protein product [Penicillium olsonii]